MTVSATDFAQFTELRASADRNDPAALREVAGQFEALFLQMMLKNMRSASLGDPIMGDSKQHELYRDMMDQQLSLDMARGKGIGLADMLVRQMGGDVASGSPARQSTPAVTAPVSTPFVPVEERKTVPSVVSTAPTETAALETSLPVAAKPKKPDWSDPESFARSVWPHVKRAAQALNVSPVGVLAQAALETGWGSKVMETPDGGSSLNLFGIKAANGWSGESVRKSTLEFENGVAAREVASFRSYASLDETLDDYADFLDQNPRYEKVRNTGDDVDAFANALSDAGYATDPDYADKIKQIFHGPTMRRVLQSITDTGSSGR